MLQATQARCSLTLLQGGVYGVDGEMVLRDGQYVSSGDLLLSLTVSNLC